MVEVPFFFLVVFGDADHFFISGVEDFFFFFFGVVVVELVDRLLVELEMRRMKRRKLLH